MAETIATWWAVSTDDGETWDGQFPRESAIAAGKRFGDGAFLIAPTQAVALEGFGPGAQQALEAAEDALSDEYEDAEIIVPDGATEALGVMLDKVWEAWLTIYRPTVTTFVVDAEKAERIEVTP